MKKWILDWKVAWENKSFRGWSILSVLTLLFIDHFIMTPLFNHIETRPSYSLNDWLLAILPPIDFSVLVFINIYFPLIWIIFRAAQVPKIFLLFMSNYAISLILRFLSIYFFPLDLPEGLLRMKDPFTFALHGGRIVEHDLFFSGHTSCMYLIYLCLEKKWEKKIGLILTITLPIMLLFQHIHYTIDIVVAFGVTIILFRGLKKVLPKIGQ